MALRKVLLWALFMVSAFGATEAGFGPLGWFEDHRDIGTVALPGEVEFDRATQEYRISGSGANMWFDRDEFHFVWRRISGDFILRAEVEFVGESGDPHRKVGVMARSDSAPDSAYVDVAVHGDGLTALQFRPSKAATTGEKRLAVSGPQVVQLERRGGLFKASVARFGDPLISEELSTVTLGEELRVGLFVCSHDADAIQQAVFRNVRLILPPPDGYTPYRDYIGSNLEVVEVQTGRRAIVHQTLDSMQAPNWTLDGGELVYNRNGLLYRFDLESGEIQTIHTGFAVHNNNDHVLSFDGAMLGISHHSQDDGGDSIVYTLPAEGGQPQRVTARGPSYLHGWSPDGKWLVYTGIREDGADIYRIPAEGGEEIRLTEAEGLDDGAEYSPDGRWIYFNSARSGSMQLWRMKPDGSEPQQLTDDGFNNWFPHVSPDGKQIVFLSYSSDVDAEDHPFYKHVYLRLMPAEGGPARVLAYVYGGQGTINVPSWSPDGKRVAFVSNSNLAEFRAVPTNQD